MDLNLPLAEVSVTSDCCSLATEVLSTHDALRYAEIFKVLGDAGRLRILSLIAREGCAPITTTDLVSELNLSQPTISHHLKKLTEAGLLTRQQSGRKAYYTIAPNPFAQLRTVLELG